MKTLSLLFGDVLVFYFTLAATLFARYGTNWTAKLQPHFVPFTALLFFWLIIFYIHDLYETRLYRNDTLFYSALFRSIAIAGVSSIAFFYLVPFFAITPKRNLIIFIAIFIVLGLLWRRAYNNLLSGKRFLNRAIFIGFEQQSEELAKFLNLNPQYGYKPLYILDTHTSAAFSFEEIDFKRISTAKELENILQQKQIKTVVLSPRAYKIPHLVESFYKNIGRGIEFLNLTTFYEQITGKVPLETISQSWFLDNIRSRKKFFELIKRVGDIIGTVVLGIPTLLATPVIALLIKLDSPGPVLYRQRRVGQGGKVFDMLKFRSMIANDPQGGAEGETGPIWAQKNDPRITRLGSLLRKTRINELPQLWNILKGEMSFVGPRAERPEFHQKLTSHIPFYEERYLVKPGASGWGQLQKDYFDSVLDTKEKLKYDLFYIKNRSLALDISIILKTINVVLRGGGR